MKNNNFAKHLTTFLETYLPNERNVSANTISSYCDTFRLLLEFCQNTKHMAIEKLRVSDISPELIKEFLSWLENTRMCGISTRNQRLAAIHSFAHYVQAESPQDVFACQMMLSVRFKKKIKPVISYLSAAETMAILSAPNDRTPNGRRDIVLLSVLYDSGSRVQEVADIKIKDVHLDFPEKIVIYGIGKKIREVALMENTAQLLRIYLKEYADRFSGNMEASLFQNRFCEKLSRAGIAYTLDKYAKIAKSTVPSIPEKVTPHVLRHTKAMHLLQSGVPLIYIRDFLGHEDISTTEIYARADIETKRQALDKASGTFVGALPSWSQKSNLMEWLKKRGRLPS